MSKSNYHPESLMMSHGYEPMWSEGAVKCPLFQTSTFAFRTAEEGKAFFEVAYGLRTLESHETMGLIYSRLNNPNLEILEERLKLWEKAENCITFSSGMAAISTTLFAHLHPGDVLLYSNPLYGGTYHFINKVLTQKGVQVIPFTANDTQESIVQRLLDHHAENRLRMIYVETPANPSLALIDLALCRRVADAFSEQRRVLLTVDNTYMGPLWQKPLEHGADLVVYSATKYLGGHSDLIAGVCLGYNEPLAPVRAMRTFLGCMPDAHTAWLLLRSLETLYLRMNTQLYNAQKVAAFLNTHPLVEKVYYLGLLETTDPQYEIHQRQHIAPGAMIAFDIQGGEAEAFSFLNNLHLFKLAVSLGSTESLAEHPATMTHVDVSTEDKTHLNISEKMIRLSIGVEHPDDLIDDLHQAFQEVEKSHRVLFQKK